MVKGSYLCAETVRVCVRVKGGGREGEVGKWYAGEKGSGGYLGRLAGVLYIAAAISYCDPGKRRGWRCNKARNPLNGKNRSRPLRLLPHHGYRYRYRYRCHYYYY